MHSVDVSPPIRESTKQSNQEIVMKRNSKSVMSVIAAAVFALFAAGCVTVPSADLTEDQVEIYKGA